MSTPTYYQIDDIKSRFQTVATTNNYQAFFQLNPYVIKVVTKRGLSKDFITEDLGLYVSDAVLPGSSFADVEVSGDRQGITERFPHTRIYDDVTFTFYVDRDYNVMKFFEEWTQIINPLKSASTGSNANVMRMTYPELYKCRMSICKFNKDSFVDPKGNAIVYTFINSWPYSISSTPVSYNGSNLLQLNVTFRYDRYVVTNITIAEDPATILKQQQLWESNLLNDTNQPEGTTLTGAGTAQELYEINNKGGTYGGPLKDVPSVNPLGEETTTPKAFKGNFGYGPGAA